jgi:hypothetical protein
MEHKPGSEGKRSGPGEGINNLNFLIILLDKGFPPCYKLKSFNAKEVGDLHIMSFLLKTILKEKKEDGMKKLVIVAIAVLLALPAVSFAGAATSRWDLAINGYVGVFAQFADQETIMMGPPTMRRDARVIKRTGPMNSATSRCR